MTKKTKYLIVNDRDSILYPVKIPLPEEPKKIDGQELPTKEQMFQYTIYPHRLKKLERECGTIKEIHDALEADPEYYSNEIDFIRQEWDRRKKGYWFMNNGNAIYIDGWHYCYLNYWKLDCGLPKYRDRDRKFFLFARFCYTDTMAFYQFKITSKSFDYYFSTEKAAETFQTNNNVKAKITRGEYLIDMKERVCYGFNYPKHRREGATYKACCINYFEVSCMLEVNGGIQAMDEPTAKTVFQEKLIRPWKKVPFFFKPIYDGSTNPKTEILFDVPAQRVTKKGSQSAIDIGLESKINFATSANRDFYDGTKLKVLHNDEVGKTTLENVDKRWMVQQQCLTQDGEIVGIAINTSTVGEMKSKGGANFLTLCNGSMYENRNELGQTTKGLYNLFIPGDDGFMVDIFGVSIIDDPTEDDLWRLVKPRRDSSGKLMGARRYHETKRESYLASDDPKSLQSYEEYVRLYPLNFSECFISAGGGSGLNLKNIVQRYKQLQFDKTATRSGNFSWESGIVDSRVIWTDDVNGRWKISFDLEQDKSNLRYTDTIKFNDIWKTVYFPMYPERFTASSDAYMFQKTEHKRVSDGAGSVFMERDYNVDGDDVLVKDWQTYRNVCTYLSRPTNPKVYAEDMLMMCIFFGALMYPEINVPLVWNHFVERNYDGFLMYGKNPDGSVRKTPGFYNIRDKPQLIFEEHQAYIEVHCAREMHIEILEQCKDIKGVEELTDYDLFVSVAGGYMGSKNRFGERIITTIKKESCDIKTYFKKRRY